jgi:hypothetical protein
MSGAATHARALLADPKCFAAPFSTPHLQPRQHTACAFDQLLCFASSMARCDAAHSPTPHIAFLTPQPCTPSTTPVLSLCTCSPSAPAHQSCSAHPTHAPHTHCGPPATSNVRPFVYVSQQRAACLQCLVSFPHFQFSPYATPFMPSFPIPTIVPLPPLHSASALAPPRFFPLSLPVSEAEPHCAQSHCTATKKTFIHPFPTQKPLSHPNFLPTTPSSQMCARMPVFLRRWCLLLTPPPLVLELIWACVRPSELTSDLLH